MSVQTAKAPRLQDLTALATEALVAAPLFVTASTGLKMPDPLAPTGTKTVVIKDDGTSGRKQLIEDRLRARGIAVVVLPLQTGKVRDQSGSSWLGDNELAVALRINPDRNADTDLGGAGVDIYEAMVAIKNALTRTARHPGGEFFRFVGYELVEFRDEGIWSYVLTFTKENVE